ncbi:CP2 transcription factor-domain-containing protein [Pilobolus umbonatus]|nr:CP2 transcription factor-domain-containing protein [Pilobolus umbonatus]
MLSVHNNIYKTFGGNMIMPFDDRESHLTIHTVDLMGNNHNTSLPGHSPPKSYKITKPTEYEWANEKPRQFFIDDEIDPTYSPLNYTHYSNDLSSIPRNSQAIRGSTISLNGSPINHQLLWQTSPSTASLISTPCYTSANMTPVFGPSSPDSNSYATPSSEFLFDTQHKSMNRYTENVQCSPADCFQYPHMTSPILYNPPGMIQDFNTKEKFHSRFNSANARLSPYVDHLQSEMYPQYICPPVLPHPSLEHPKTPPAEKNDQHKTKLSFQFNAVLHAPTAVLRNERCPSITYLNRGQSYLIDLDTTQYRYPGTMTSTFSLTFHESSHLAVAESYWKFWISQQKNPNKARAIDLDTNQTTGIYNIRYPTFDSVSFDWHGRFGAKIYVRFNCLSTDFSRIKGVKGIPMRAVMTTHMNFPSLPARVSDYPGTFHTKKTGSSHPEEVTEYIETFYCQIKLFRDKGAERKNKDDSKQLAKQIEKILPNANPKEHPSWSLVNQSFEPVTTFTEIPSPMETSITELAELPVPTKKRKQSVQSVVNVKKSRTESLIIYVWTQTHDKPQEIVLEKLTIYELKSKLTALLNLHLNSVSEILWVKKTQETSGSISPNVYVLVEDTFISEHIREGELMTVNWEIKEDGHVRLILTI